MNHMFSFESEANLVVDREDLIAVLQMRFDFPPGDVITKIYEINDYHTLQRLIIVAANAASWSVFLQELEEGEKTFRLVGEQFNPLRDPIGRDITNGAKAE